MKLVTPLLKRVVYPCMARTGLLQHGVRPKDLSVITYHGVLPQGYGQVDPMLDGAMVSADAFRRQLRLLKSHYNIIDPGQLAQEEGLRESVPPRSVLVTCDDGLLNTLTEMMPILEEEKVPCLFFVTGLSASASSRMLWYEELDLMMLAARDDMLIEGIDPDLAKMDSTKRGDLRSFWWSLVRKWSRFGSEKRDQLLAKTREQLRLGEDWPSAFLEDPIRRRRFLVVNRVELQQLAASSRAIGSHTLSHPVLSQMSHDLAWQEIAESRRILEETLKVPVWALAYPFGDPDSTTRRDREMADRAGYKWAFSNGEDNLEDFACRFEVPRVHITGNMSLAEFEAHVSGFHETLRRRFVKPIAVPVAAG